jgi:hypothetical protein
MTRPRRLAVLAAIVALALSACSSQDAEVSDVVEAMEDAGLNRSEADCVGDGFEAADFTQEDLNDIAAAETPEDYPGDTADRIREILDTCASEASSSTTESDTSDSSDTSDTTESTESTTTTTAG